jgi:predicted nucleic-acid-binding Zn-ribbon protein
MKTAMRQMTKSSAGRKSKTERKIRRRHTRVHLDSLRPAPPNNLTDTLSQCPKCQGLVLKECGETSEETVIRCLNCGWQPHYQAPMIQETAESRTIRSLTAQFVSEYDWHRLPVGF